MLFNVKYREEEITPCMINVLVQDGPSIGLAQEVPGYLLNKLTNVLNEISEWDRGVGEVIINENNC